VVGKNSVKFVKIQKPAAGIDGPNNISIQCMHKCRMP
jgi:hypothetical protein